MNQNIFKHKLKNKQIISFMPVCENVNLKISIENKNKQFDWQDFTVTYSGIFCECVFCQIQYNY